MKSKLNYALLVATLGAIPSSTYAQITWDGDTDGNWNTGTNWLLDTAPVAGDALVFTGSTNVITNNDITAGTSIAGITFDASAGDFTLAGNNIFLTAGITSLSGAHTIALDMELNGNKFVNADSGTTITITGDISGGGALLTNQGGSYEGEVVLSGNNSYTGQTRTQGGTLRITTSDSLGDGILDIRDNGAVEPIVILDATAGDLTFTNGVRFFNAGTVKVLSVIGGDATISGDVELADLAADDGSFAVSSGNTLTLSGVINGGGILNIDSDRTIDSRAVVGGGTVVLQGSNTHTGGTVLEEGILRLEHDNALGTGALTIEQRGNVNPILVLDNGRTIANELIISDQGGNKRINLLGGTTNAATWSGNITVNETTANNFDISSNATDGDDSAQMLTISGDITSTAGAGLEIIGDGIVRLTGNNNITDTINISNRGSKLRVGHNNALGTADVIIGNRAAELQLEDGITTNVANNLTVKATSNATKKLTVHDGDSGTAESATFTGNISVEEEQSKVFEIEAETLDTLTISGVISNTTSTTGHVFEKIGGGTVILTGANTYDGITTISAGTLQLGDGTSGNDGSNVGSSIINNANLTYNTFGAGSYAGGITGTGSVTKLGAGTQTLSGALQLGVSQQAFDITSNGDSAPELTIYGNIGAAGNFDLTKTGTGTLLLSGDNSAGAVIIGGVEDADFDGINRLRIEGGTVQIEQANNLGDNSIFISDGANEGTLEFVGSSATTIENEISFRGNAGTNTTLRASGTSSAATVEYSYGNLGGNGDTLTLDGSNTGLNTIGFDLNANGNGLAGGLTKAGTGTWVLKAGVAQDYSGATTVSAGILMINGDSSLATGDVNVASGATLGGSGTIGGDTTIAAGGFLNPGNSPGLMTFEGDLTLAGTTTMEIDGAVRGTGFDAIDVGGLLTYGGALVISADSTIAAGTYDLFGIDGSLAGDFTSIILSGLAYSDDALSNSGGVWTTTLSGTTYTFTQSTGDLFVAVPEPGTFALIAGMLALTSIAMRRRHA